MENKRYNKRISFHVDAAAKINNTMYNGELYDISLKGALMKIEKNIETPANSLCNVILKLPNSIITLEFEAKIVHRNNNFYGFRFEGANVDSITHLRRLLVLNTGDEEGIDRELSSWLHNK
ncbi:MAG: PilZ domain-containing protein [Spirochaetaceae bacterium]|nr:PilZ domain-containing protein [Spirochaetaceae bacterium]